MLSTQKIIVIATIAISASSVFYGCAKDEKTPLDEWLIEESLRNDLVYYKGQDQLLDPKGSSPHPHFKLLFNPKAASVLDASGKLPIGASFPDSSLVLKVTYKPNGEDIKELVPMYKLSTSEYSENGWLWAKYSPTGSKALYSVSNKGDKCASCHSSSGNRDFTLAFDLH
ncbi:MAG TPA: cytochrome P460 family protein [Chitinophagales bacterium]|nr:cytochrome P460 family protein [Chitinophagales bacterium]